MRSPAADRAHAVDRRCRPGGGPLLTPTLALALFALALGGCSNSAEPPDGTEVQVRDSAGIRIVEYAGTPSTPTVTLADEPTYTHGTAPGDYLFSNIDFWKGGVLYANGDAVLYDSGNREIVSLTREGTRHMLLARAGEGPGEIGWTVNLLAGGPGTLLVDDRGHRRLTLFADGAVARSARMPGAADRVQLEAHGLDADGRVLMSSGSSSTRDFDGRWKRGHMVRFDLETRLADTVASFDRTRAEPQRPGGPTLYSYAGVVGAVGGEFVHGRNDIPELVWRRPDGTVRQIMRWAPERVYPTAESRDRFLACRRASLRADPDRTEAMIEEDLAWWRFNFDEPEPLFAAILGDGQSSVWLEHWQAHCYNELRYTVIGPEGKWLGTFEPPGDFRLLHVSGDRALGEVRDEMDRESAVVYELVGW